MMQSFEPVFLLTAVPAEVASAVATAGALAIVTLYRNGRADSREALNAMRDQRESIDKLTNVVTSLVEYIKEDREGKRARSG